MEVVRNIVGLEPSVAKQIFVKYTNDNTLNTKQIKFVKLLTFHIIMQKEKRAQDIIKELL